MCGICGFFEQIPKAGPQTLRRMNERIVHRGPDDDGYWQNGEVGLAARRLSIIDLVTGHQPLSSHLGCCWIAFNGEIYNFAELRSELEDRGVGFRTKSDTEVVVNLYQEFGLDFVRKLRGMFALAIYDERQRRLVLARDRIGKKPLYYCRQENGNLVFASEIKAILPYPGIARDLDEEALDLFLTLEYVPAPHSIFRSIRKLPAGHLLTYDGQKMAVSSYWELPAAERQSNFAELREEFLQLLGEAVRIRMIADVPLGAFLSGGIDSSSVVAMMARQTCEPVKTFSIGFEEKSYSELPYARRVASLFGTEHTEKILQPDIGGLVRLLGEHLDEPMADFSNFPTYLVAQTAREKVTVVLSGDGGDEIFGGYEHYLAQRLSGWLDQPLFRPLGKVATATAALLPPSALKKGLLNRSQRFGAGLAFSPQNRHWRWMIHLSADQKRNLYTPAFRQESYLRELYERSPFAEHLQDSRAFSGLNRDLYLDLKTYLVDDIMVKVDRMSMAVSLEARAPLLDHKLVEFAFTLPARFKVRGACSKWFFKRAMVGILPAEIIYRRKEGFSIPIKNWLKTELREMMLETLAKKKLVKLGLFEPDYVATLIHEHLENRRNHSHRLWPLIVFQLWADHYLTSAPLAQP